MPSVLNGTPDTVALVSKVSRNLTWACTSRHCLQNPIHCRAKRDTGTRPHLTTSMSLLVDLGLKRLENKIRVTVNDRANRE